MPSGDQSAVEPPGPIPNPEVKRCSADGSETIGLVRVGRRQVFAPSFRKRRRGTFLYRYGGGARSVGVRMGELSEGACWRAAGRGECWACTSISECRAREGWREMGTPRNQRETEPLPTEKNPRIRKQRTGLGIRAEKFGVEGERMASLRRESIAAGDRRGTQGRAG